MRRDHEGMMCVYCAESVCESSDHVFAREFFPKNDRGNLPKVPACNRCNNAKAALERYATCVLPFGSRHPEAIKVIQEVMPRRLRENRHIQRELLRSQGRTLVVEPNGLLLPTTTFRADSKKIVELMRYIIQGLMWFHWGICLKRTETDIQIRTARVEGDPITRAIFDQFLSKYGSIAKYVKQNFGNGTIRYEGIGVIIPDRGALSMWRIQLLDSVYSVPGGPARGFLITTGPRAVGAEQVAVQPTTQPERP